MIQHTLRPFLLTFMLVLSATSALYAQIDPGSGALIQKQTPLQIAPETGTLSFERESVDFAPQSAGIENCINLSLTNTTDRPRLLTDLRSSDPRHFYITSPAQGMMPLTIGANSTFILNLCFKADDVRAYKAQVLAIFQTDTVHLGVTGQGVAPPEVVPVPKETSVTEVRYKNHKWIFQFGLSKRGTIHLVLENTLGKAVRTFPFPEVKTAGFYEVTFDGKSDEGKKLEKATYILRLEATEQDGRTKVHSSKLVTIK